MTKKRISLLGVAGLIPVLLALWVAGFDIAYQLGYYVLSDDGVVTGGVVQAPAPAAGQVTDLLVEVGERVAQGQALATLATGLATPGQAAGTSPRLATHVRAPLGGTVLFLGVTRGQSVTAGQSVAVLAELDSLWIIANVDETSLRAIRPGQRAEVYLPALDATFPGSVVEVLPGVTNLASLTGAARTQTIGGAKPTAQMPVKVEFDYSGAKGPVLPGMSATVRIFLRG